MRLSIACFAFAWTAASANIATIGAAESILGTPLPKVGRPLPNAHAHNDYEHARPLLDALALGFGSVEADIHLTNGVLLVGHDAEDLRPGRTLQKLYLEPLRELAAKNGGRIYRDAPPLILLVDIKTEAEATYAALRLVLAEQGGLLTRFKGTEMERGAVTVILSGNRPRETLQAEQERLAAFDGRLADLDSGWPKAFMPLVSDNWRLHFAWKGEGAVPESDRAKLAGIIARAKADGRMIRFWGVPDGPAAWKILRDAQVSLIGTDNLTGLADFLRPSN